MTINGSFQTWTGEAARAAEKLEAEAKALRRASHVLQKIIADDARSEKKHGGQWESCCAILSRNGITPPRAALLSWGE